MLRQNEEVKGSAQLTVQEFKIRANVLKRDSDALIKIASRYRPGVMSRLRCLCFWNETKKIETRVKIKKVAELTRNISKLHGHRPHLDGVFDIATERRYVEGLRRTFKEIFEVADIWVSNTTGLFSVEHHIENANITFQVLVYRATRIYIETAKLLCSMMDPNGEHRELIAYAYEHLSLFEKSLDTHKKLLNCGLEAEFFTQFYKRFNALQFHNDNPGIAPV